MDPRLQVDDPLRRLPAGVTAETPLVTLAWRALRSEHQRRAEERRSGEAEAGRVSEALAAIAKGVYLLRRSARAAQQAPVARAAGGDAQNVAALADGLEQALASLEVSIVAPEGEAFTPERMELLENIAQRPVAGLSEPRVAEVVAPAVLRRGALLHMGKAVIEVPAEGASG